MTYSEEKFSVSIMNAPYRTFTHVITFEKENKTLCIASIVNIAYRRVTHTLLRLSVEE